MTVLRHYAHKPLGELRDCEQDPDRNFKPVGLWLSVEGNGDGWREWCEAEDFATGWTHVYDVTLVPDANVLRIDSAEGVRRLGRDFRHANPVTGRGEVDWHAVSQKYDGVVIAPYQWECRLEPETFWYYGWDCASGVIWRVRAIASVTPTPEPDRAPPL